MANKIVNAVGTEMQFMPQPDNTYQERVQGVQGARGTTPATSASAMFAQSSNNFNSNWLQFLTDREKRMNDEGLTLANRMISATSEDDIQRLNTIDIAQKYGYATAVDNPYFIAYSDKLRGKQLGDLAKAQYNDLYGDNPAPTVDDELARYDGFIKDYRSRFMDENIVANNTAFMEGFNTNSLANASDLATTHVQRDVADRLAESYHNIQSEVGDLIYKAPSMSMKDIQQKATEIFNQGRLMALSPDQRYSLVDLFTKEILSTGTIKDFKEFKKVMDNVTVDTRLDGTEVKMSDLVDPMALDELNLTYRKAHISQIKMNARKKYGKDANMDRFNADVIKGNNSKSRSERDDAEVLESDAGNVSALQQEHKASIARNTRLATSNAKGAVHRAATSASVQANFEAWMNGDNTRDGYGNLIGAPMIEGKAASSNDIYQEFRAQEQSISDSDADDDTKMKRLMRLFSYPASPEVRKLVETQGLADINGMNPQDVENNGVPNSIILMTKMYQANRNQFRGTFGAKIASAIDSIVNLANNTNQSDANNALILGYSRYLQSHHVDDPTKQSYDNQFKGITANGWDIGDMIDYSDTALAARAPAIAFNNDQIASVVYDTFMSYMPDYNGNPDGAQLAMNKAAQDVADNYGYFHGGIFPRYLHTGLPPDAEQVNTQRALATLEQDYINNHYGVTDNDVYMSYNPNATGAEFRFYDYITGDSKTYSTSDMVNEILYLYDNPPTTDYTVTESTNNSDYSFEDTSPQAQVANAVPQEANESWLQKGEDAVNAAIQWGKNFMSNL